MHISDGILSNAVLVSGIVTTITGVGIGLKRIEPRDVPKVGVMSAAFFITSFIHIPIGSTSIHLLLNGLIGIILGWAAFPAILVGLFLQAVAGHGGFTTLGVNTAIIGIPAIGVHYLFRLFNYSENKILIPLGHFSIGFLAIFFSATLLFFAMITTGTAFTEVAIAAFIGQLPLMVVEGLITLFSLQFLLKVSPGILVSTNFRNHHPDMKI